MIAPFDCYTIYTYREDSDEWLLVSLINRQLRDAEGLKELTSCGIRMNCGKTRIYDHNMGHSIPVMFPNHQEAI